MYIFQATAEGQDPWGLDRMPARIICILSRRLKYLSITSHSPLIEGCCGCVNFPSCALCSNWAGLEKVLGQKSWKIQAKHFEYSDVSVNLSSYLTVQQSCDYNQAGLRNCDTGHQKCLPQQARSQLIEDSIAVPSSREGKNYKGGHVNWGCGGNFGVL